MITEGMTYVATVNDRERAEAYSAFLAKVRENFKLATADGAPLFVTKATKLFPRYLATFNSLRKQEHNCTACRDFLNHYGNLVTIDGKGYLHSALFGNLLGVPEPYYSAALALKEIVEGSRVESTFYDSATFWGTAAADGWEHICIEPPATHVFSAPDQTAFQAIAESREDCFNMQRALEEFSPALVNRAVSLLVNGTLKRAEKVLGPARFLQDLYAKINAASGTRQKNHVLWLTFATAPAGFKHPRKSMIGFLLKDLAAGFALPALKRRFDEKMDELLYLRAQEAPAEGNKEAAEKLIAKLGYEPSLHRRFARLEELKPIWAPRQAPAQNNTGSVFGHLPTKGKQDNALVQQALLKFIMTWEKFARTVLPEAESISLVIPSQRTNFMCFTTAVNPDAPPIIQWDTEEERNPVSMYTYSEGSLASEWNLVPGALCAVQAVVLQPSAWGAKKYNHFGNRAMFILAGARDMKHKGKGNALFSEFLRSELRPIRSTIEAYSQAAELSGYEEASAGGLMMADGAFHEIRVKSRGIETCYKIDRWD